MLSYRTNPKDSLIQRSSLPIMFGGSTTGTNPEKGWFQILRLCSPRQSFLDKTWRISEVEEVRDFLILNYIFAFQEFVVDKLTMS
ncbi:MAG: hypothetical protein KAR20_22860 [Candidatus Heimdallarchaeota archaeon]|nr:hypothetical protein [Candidatus Heimdallarchaeota archaeon]